jgi:hypothetical protein
MEEEEETSLGEALDAELGAPLQLELLELARVELISVEDETSDEGTRVLLLEPD